MTKTVNTMCPMNCHPTLCGMKVSVSDGTLRKIEGDEGNPDSRGFLCMRGNAAHEIVGNSKRLDTPLIRVARGTDDWRRASWDEVLDIIATKMRTVGREAVGMWQGHGNAVNDYGTGVKRAQMERFANLYGCQHWNPAMVCWGLGGFGLGLTGALETSTKEDMGAHSELIVLWGANTVSQANSFRHVEAAKQRGARVVVVDVRRTEASALADDVLLVRPGSDAALALGMMHVILKEGLWDRDFVRDHTVGFAELEAHVPQFTPSWAAQKTGLTADQVVEFARDYARTEPAMIIIGGSSMHKTGNTWQGARAISCLPALTGNYGKAGGGIGPRHGARSHGAGFGDISATDKRRPGRYIPNQMEAIVEGLETGAVKVMLSIGSNILSSFAQTNRMRAALGKAELVVVYDIFANQTTRDVADIILPGTIWLEELGVKATNTHVYLCDKALPPAGDVRPVFKLYQGLAARLDVNDVYPWDDQEAAIDAVLDHPATGHACVSDLRKNGGMAALNISAVAYPDYRFHTPSGKIEFFSQKAVELGLSGLPEAGETTLQDADFPLSFAHGRTFAHFHSFYDHARALPTLAKREVRPELWISTQDAQARGIKSDDEIEMRNDLGRFDATAKVMARIPAGTVWMRDGWPGLNALTSGRSVVPDGALDAFAFSVGQASYSTRVEVTKRV